MVEDRRLAVEVASIHAESRQRYGSPRVHAELRERGKKTSRKRVARLMRQQGLRARHKRRFRTTTDSAHEFPVAPNRLKRKFEVDAPNTAWVTDITYIWTREGWLYLAVILDLFSRRVVGWAMSEKITRQLALAALTMALSRRQPPRGLIHHSDRGSQYASSEYRRLLAANNIVCSMSRRGDCGTTPSPRASSRRSSSSSSMRATGRHVRRPSRDLRVPGGVLQPRAPSFVAGLPQPGCVRTSSRGESGSITWLSTESGLAPSRLRAKSRTPPTPLGCGAIDEGLLQGECAVGCPREIGDGIDVGGGDVDLPVVRADGDRRCPVQRGAIDSLQISEISAQRIAGVSSHRSGQIVGSVDVQLVGAHRDAIRAICACSAHPDIACRSRNRPVEGSRSETMMGLLPRSCRSTCRQDSARVRQVLAWGESVEASRLRSPDSVGRP